MRRSKGSGGEAGEAGQRIVAQAVILRKRNAELTAGMAKAPCDPFKISIVIFIHFPC
jgi:hypothetical protein